VTIIAVGKPNEYFGAPTSCAKRCALRKRKTISSALTFKTWRRRASRARQETVSLVAALDALPAFKVDYGTAIEDLKAGAQLDSDTVTDIGEWQIGIQRKAPGR
jgi:hypothetical protein